MKKDLRKLSSNEEEEVCIVWLARIGVTKKLMGSFLMPKKSLLFLLLFHLLLYMVVILNISVMRQITVFIYLSLIPGFVLLKLLKLTETLLLEKILLIVGLSLAFLMFAGFIINGLFFALGISMPLTFTPLLISLSFLTLTLSFIAYRKDLTANLKLSASFFELKDVVPKSVIVLPLILGVVGSLYSNVYILSLMIISIVVLYVLSIFSNSFASLNSLSLILFLVSLALIIQVSLTSRYVIGWDANAEYYVFKLTANSGHWAVLSTASNSVSTVNYSSMLSITILPTIYYSLMNTSGEVVFKTLYPFIFSLVPMTLFTFCSKQLGKKVAVLSTLFFISGSLVFYGFEPLSINRQVVGMLFLALSILIILDKRLQVGKRRFLLVVFAGVLIVSHYSLTLIFLFLIFSLFIILKIKKYRDNLLDFRLVLLLFIMVVAWDGYTFSILKSIYQNLSYIFSSFLSDFGSANSRAGWLAGSHPAYGSNINFAGDINWSFLVIANLFLAIGVVGLLGGLLVKSKKWSIDPKYQIICILSGFILLLCLFVPNLGSSLNFTRFYAISLLFLSPCFVMGGELVVDIIGAFLKRITKRRFLVNIKQITKVLLCIVIVGYFLSQSGFVNIVAGAVPLSYSLDYSRASTSLDKNVQVNLNSVIIPEQDVFSASWLLSYRVGTTNVVADEVSRVHVLVSYGLIPNNLILPMTNSTIPPQGSYIYLSSFNLLNGIITTASSSFNASQISFLNQNNLIYANGYSEIWCATLNQ